MLQKENDVRLYTRLYAAFLGSLSQPLPRFVFNPSLFLIILLGEVLAAIFF